MFLSCLLFCFSVWSFVCSLAVFACVCVCCLPFLSVCLCFCVRLCVFVRTYMCLPAVFCLLCACLLARLCGGLLPELIARLFVDWFV